MAEPKLTFDVSLVRTMEGGSFWDSIAKQVAHSSRFDFRGRRLFAEKLYERTIDRLTTGKGIRKLRDTTLLDKGTDIPLVRTGGFVQALEYQASAKGKPRQVRLFWRGGYARRAELFARGIEEPMQNSTSGVFRFWGRLPDKRYKQNKRLTQKQGWVFAKSRQYPSQLAPTAGAFGRWAFPPRQLFPPEKEIAGLVESFFRKSERPLSMAKKKSDIKGLTASRLMGLVDSIIQPEMLKASLRRV